MRSGLPALLLYTDNIHTSHLLSSQCSNPDPLRPIDVLVLRYELYSTLTPRGGCPLLGRHLEEDSEGGGGVPAT